MPDNTVEGTSGEGAQCISWHLMGVCLGRKKQHYGILQINFYLALLTPVSFIIKVPSALVVVVKVNVGGASLNT